MIRYCAIVPLLLLLSFGCSEPEPIIGPEREQIVTMADPITDHLLEGWNNDDYAAYTRDFNEEMLAAMDEEKYEETREQIMGAVGQYQSRLLASVVRKDGYRVVIYTAEFEKETGVQIRVVFEADSPRIAGLWFDSPALREL